MNKILLSVMLLLLASARISAQTGWQWGKNNRRLAGEFFCSAADNYGNFFATVKPGVGALPGPDTLGSIVSQYPLVAKLDSAGNYLWVLECGAAMAQGLVTDPAGNLYILGQYYASSISLGGVTLISSTSLYGQVFLAKVSSAGTVLWAKNVMTGAIYLDPAFCFSNLGVDNAGNTIVTGQFKPASISIGTTTLTNTDPAGSTTDIFICKYNSAGNLIWTKSFAGKKDDYLFTTTVTKNGNIYLSGSYTSDSLKINSSTTLQTDPLSSFDTTRLFFPRLKGNFLVKLNTNGDLLWAHNMDYHERAVAMCTDDKEDIYVTGLLDSTVVHGSNTLFSMTGYYNSSAYFASYTSSGNFKWGVSSLGSGESGYGIVADACGNLLVCGSMHGNMAFSGHTLNYPTQPGVAFLPEPAFIVEYDTAGVYHNSMTIDAGGEDGISISVDNRGNFFIEGDYWNDTVVFAHDTLRAFDYYEYLFLAKYKYQTSLCEAEIALGVADVPAAVPDVTIYPNPATNECTLSCKDGFNKNAKAEMYDITGRLMGVYPLSGTATVISLSGFHTGVYQCRIYSNNNVLTKRVAIINGQ